MRLRPLPAAAGLRPTRFVLPRQALRPSPERAAIQATFRRNYATETIAKPPKRRFRFLRFLWRTTYLTTLAGAGYLAYTIYETRYPTEQVEPDPSKKTLVILGMQFPRLTASSNGSFLPPDLD